MIGIYDTDGNEKLRVPVALVQLFADDPVEAEMAALVPARRNDRPPARA
ncbi:hypothetical protein GCM10007937_25200 [Mesorhizobium albiziae]|nr:hypothetical protein [Mesorhizobium albiziae]GLS30812.1 hypothetical protein GCM10007937_25200 [Mesorhizobium albiziae]